MERHHGSFGDGGGEKNVGGNVILLKSRGQNVADSPSRVFFLEVALTPESRSSFCSAWTTRKIILQLLICLDESRRVILPFV